jgi:hypothetical protein
MTEAEWMDSPDAAAMLEFLLEGKRPSVRKLRLFVCAFWRWQAQNLTVKQRDGLLRRTDLMERWAETGKCPSEARPSRSPQVVFFGNAIPSARLTATAPSHWNTENGRQAAAVMPHFVREIFGNPFRAAIEPAWLSADVMALAEGAYAECAFERLPIVADALEDAGCTHSELLNHCRTPGNHARGCWALDDLLGKA